MQIWRTDTKIATSWIQIVISYCKWNEHVIVTRMRLAARSTVILGKLIVTKLLKYSLPVTGPEIQLLKSQQPVTSIHSPIRATQIQHISFKKWSNIIQLSPKSRCTAALVVGLRLICAGTRAETRIHLSVKRTNPLKSAGESVQSTTGSRVENISVSNAGYTMFRGSVRGTGYPLHSPGSPSLPLPFVTVCHHISTGLY